MSSPARRSLPDRPSLEQLRKMAKDLVRDARAGDASARARLTDAAASADDAPATLTRAQLAIAREYGFQSWPRLVRHVEGIAREGFALRPLIRPVELAPGRRYQVGGTETPSDDVFAIFVAAREGDSVTVKRLVGRYARARDRRIQLHAANTLRGSRRPSRHCRIPPGPRGRSRVSQLSIPGITADVRGGSRTRRSRRPAARASVDEVRSRVRHAGRHRRGGSRGRRHGRGAALPKSWPRTREQRDGGHAAASRGAERPLSGRPDARHRGRRRGRGARGRVQARALGADAQLVLPERSGPPRRNRGPAAGARGAKHDLHRGSAGRREDPSATRSRATGRSRTSRTRVTTA